MLTVSTAKSSCGKRLLLHITGNVGSGERHLNGSVGDAEKNGKSLTFYSGFTLHRFQVAEKEAAQPTNDGTHRE